MAEEYDTYEDTIEFGDQIRTIEITPKSDEGEHGSYPVRFRFPKTKWYTGSIEFHSENGLLTADTSVSLGHKNGDVVFSEARKFIISKEVATSMAVEIGAKSPDERAREDRKSAIITEASVYAKNDEEFRETLQNALGQYD